MTDSRVEFSERAYEDVYRATFPAVWSIVRRLARTDEEAEDACQHAYLALYRYWSAGALREPPSHLLYRAARRAAIDTLRRRRRGLRLFERLARPTAPAEDVGGPLGRALRKLRPEDATLVMLQGAAGVTYEELAAIEGTSVGAVRSRLFRARQRLARLYEDEGGTW